MSLSIRWLARFAALWLAAACMTGAAAQPAPRTNIVLIVADDQGWKDVGFHGSDIATPTLDKLASGGARLEAFYAQPMCTPTRAALMSGRYPHRYGLQTLVIPSNGRYGLPTDERLLPQVLADADYRTAIVGKWHLGHAERPYWPLQRGFQHQYGPAARARNRRSHRGGAATRRPPPWRPGVAPADAGRPCRRAAGPCRDGRFCAASAPGNRGARRRSFRPRPAWSESDVASKFPRVGGAPFERLNAQLFRAWRSTNTLIFTACDNLRQAISN